MIKKSTVLILGAGASVPYGFSTGWDMLSEARSLSVGQLCTLIAPHTTTDAEAFHDVLRYTGETSIDAVLEGRDDLSEAGKVYIARHLLNEEKAARDKYRTTEPARAWYRELFTAMLAPTLEQFRANPLTILTYNYDRSLDRFLIDALVTKYWKNTPEQCAAALDCIGPWHLHGQLGALPELPVDGIGVVPYGGHDAAITESNVAGAAKAIKIIHEVDMNPNTEAFRQAYQAIAAADRLVALGFSFGDANVRRLHFEDCLKDETEVFASSKGPIKLQTDIGMAFPRHALQGKLGTPGDDVLGFIHRVHQVFERAPSS